MTAFRIVHVDDEPEVREAVEISLGLDPDLATRSCASGLEALAVASDWTPDIILLDVVMPVMDGVATLVRLRENSRTAGIPVVFMTVHPRSSELFRSFGAVGVIPKPFDPMMLAASVRAYIEPPDTGFTGLKNAFLIRVDRDLSALARHWSALEDGSSVLASLAAIGSIAHGLAGAGGIFGFDEISDAAAALEEAVILERDSAGTLEEVGSALERMLICAETAEVGKP
jgi:two-component system OmpR family response regulator